MSQSASNPLPGATQVPVAIERYFQTSLFLLIVTGFITLLTTGKLDVLSIVFVSAALIFRGHLLWNRRDWQIPEKISSYLGLVYLFVFVADFFLLSQNFVTATVHLMLFGMVVKIFSVQRDRDYLYLAVLAFLEVLSAAILTVDSVFLGALSVFVLIAVVTFMAMEMRRSAQRAGRIHRPGLDVAPRTSGRRFRQMPYSLSAAGVLVVAAILLCSVGIFFVLPRLSGGYLGQLAQQNDLVSGFSDNVQLGEIGRIQQSSQVVAHVRIANGARGYSFVLRGSTLSNFDGRRWFNPPKTSDLISTMGGDFNLRHGVSGTEGNYGVIAAGPTREIVRYRVSMEPIGTNVIFLIPSPYGMVAPFREIAVDGAYSFMNTDRDRPVGTYEGVSDFSRPTMQQLVASESAYPVNVTRRYLQLPTLDPRIPQLAQELTASARNPYEAAAAIQAHLGKFAYTLELPSTVQTDPLATFLFSRKAGHCEYFAATMTVMLRARGIPARMVTGFRGGEYNDLTGNYIIRARDAHSWVEAYFPGNGWVMFDPTPGAEARPNTVWTRAQLYVDAMREFWHEWIVNYDFLHQQRLSTAAMSTSTRSAERVRRWGSEVYERLLARARQLHGAAVRSPREFVMMVVAGAGCLMFLLYIPAMVRMAVRRRAAKNPARAPQIAASIWYGRLTKVLGRRGYRKQPAQTPLEFAETIEDPILKPAVTRFTEHYERARFGDSAEDAVRLPELYDQVASNK